MRGLRVGGVPLHPLLVHFPIAAWSVLPFLDATHYVGFGVDPGVGRAIALFGAGMGLIAMIAGAVDLVTLARPEHRGMAMRHMTLMASAWAVALLALVVRKQNGETLTFFVTALDMLTLLLLAIGGHLGGQLVHVHGASVDTPQQRI